MTTHSYTEWSAQQRAERSEGEPGLSLQAKVEAFLAIANNDLHRVAVRQRATLDRLARLDARLQFQARMEAI